MPLLTNTIIAGKPTTGGFASTNVVVGDSSDDWAKFYGVVVVVVCLSTCMVAVEFAVRHIWPDGYINEEHKWRRMVHATWGPVILVTMTSTTPNDTLSVLIQLFHTWGYFLRDDSKTKWLTEFPKDSPYEYAEHMWLISHHTLVFLFIATLDAFPIDLTWGIAMQFLGGAIIHYVYAFAETAKGKWWSTAALLVGAL